MSIFFIALLLASAVSACTKQKQTCSIVLDGISVQSTPGLLVELEAHQIPVTLAVSLADLKAFEEVRLIAREASWRGHTLALAWPFNDPSATIDWTQISKDWYEATGSDIKYVLPSVPKNASHHPINYNLDLTPDYVTNVPQLVLEQLKMTPTTGRLIYGNSFAPGMSHKILDAVSAYRSSSFSFIPIDKCI